MLKGTVSLLQPEEGLGKMLGSAPLVSEVCLSGKPTYTFQWTTSSDYHLINSSGRVIDQRSFKFRFLKTIIDLSIDSYPLKYQIGFFGKRTLVTAIKKHPTYFELGARSRSYEFEDMKFKHSDFSSEIQFQCPEERLIQAIYIASFLFNPPLMGED